VNLLNLFKRQDVINPDYPLIQPIAATVGNWIEHCPGEALKTIKQLYDSLSQMMTNYASIMDLGKRADFMDGVCIMMYYLAKRIGDKYIDDN